MPHPVTAADYAHALSGEAGAVLHRMARAVPRGQQRLLVITDPFAPIDPAAARPARSPLPFTLAVNLPAIGVIGYLAGPDVYVFDEFSLANPIGSHTTVVHHARPGHEKLIGPAWMLGPLRGAGGDRRALRSVAGLDRLGPGGAGLRPAAGLPGRGHRPPDLVAGARQPRRQPRLHHHALQRRSDARRVAAVRVGRRAVVTALGEEGARGPAGGRRALLVAGPVYLALAVALWWHTWSTHPSTVTTCGCGDAARFLWYFRWPAFALAHGHDVLYSTYLFHPGGINLLDDTSVVALGVVLAPVTWLAGPVTAMNVALTLAPTLSALSMFVLLRRWVRWAPAALLGGLVYGFSPFMVTELALNQLNIAFLAVPPLVVLVLADLVVYRRRRPWVDGLALAGLAVVQFFVSTEVLVITGLSVLVGTVLLVGWAAWRRPAELAARAGAVWAVWAWPSARPPWCWPTRCGSCWTVRPTWSGPSGRPGPPPGTARRCRASCRRRVWPGSARPCCSSAGTRAPCSWASATSASVSLIVAVVGTVVVAARPDGCSCSPGSVWWPPCSPSVPATATRSRGTPCSTCRGSATSSRSASSWWWPSAWRCSSPWRSTTPDTPSGPGRHSTAAPPARWPGGWRPSWWCPRWPPCGPTSRSPRGPWCSPPGTPRRGTTLPPGRVVLAYPVPSSGLQSSEAWQAVNAMGWAQASGGGPQGQPSRAGAARPGFEVLSAASLPLGPAPVPTATTVAAVRSALRQWKVTTVVVPDQPGLPVYAPGRGGPYAAGFFTAVLRRGPHLRRPGLGVGARGLGPRPGPAVRRRPSPPAPPER